MLHNHVRIYIIFGVLTLFVTLSVNAQLNDEFSRRKADSWADSVYNSLSDKERIGQLLFIRANYSGEPYLKNVPDLISKYNLGGVTFFANDPLKQAVKTNEWNELAKTPLFISIDAEWGLGMRLKNTMKYPLQMTLGAIENDSLIYEMGMQIGEQCNRMGIHINFAPVVDVNNNPQNPVIGMRSFGEDPNETGEKGYMYMLGLQNKNVIACAKHFPGHGDTKTDSHLDLPILKKSKKELRSTELVPFSYLIENGVDAVMTAHLSVTAFDKKKNRPASLSEKIVQKQLKEKMGFEGLVITDGLDMKGVTKNVDKDEIPLEAFLAGNDILLIPDEIPASIEKMLVALEKGKISRERLEESCKKILRYKYLAGAAYRKEIETEGLVKDLSQSEYLSLRDELFEQAITVVKNEAGLVPLSFPDTLKPVLLIIGEEKSQVFEYPFQQFKPVETVYLKHDASATARQDAITKLEHANLVIIGIVNTNILASRRFGVTQSDIQFIEHIARSKAVILNIFASPYVLNFFSSSNDFETIIVSYQNKPFIQQKSAEIILGMSGASGRLPVSAGEFTEHTGIITQKTRLTYEDPIALGIDTSLLKKIDSIAMNGVDIRAYPGCQILAAKDGFIFYDKTFGHHTYENERTVKKTDVYDLASLTKILATTPAIMVMADQNKIDMDGYLSDYLLYLKGTNKEYLKLRDIMTHQSGLEPWIPYYQSTLFENDWDTTVYRSVISEGFPVRVAQNMYIRENFKYGVYDQIIESELREQEYAYSDLGFYFFKEMIEQLTNQPFDKYLYTEFYKPMGLNYLCFRPRKLLPAKSIVPTENDQVFRHQVLRGDVHDQGAAMLGGISGHAGLFGNAYDVAVVMQMFLNGGSYGGRQFFSKDIVEEFTTCQFPERDNRRGLGFDKPLLEFEEHRTNCKDASPESFGHSGFTGTYTWADPENGLVYVFLSNRVYPDMNNGKLMELDIRTNIHQLFYESIK